ncbi:hypothetical protein L0664_13295 [Octadecabacter sp. G9-8]|uniref:Uncharacterized protein n=1 Tax=Octadecabacter dasysiphoniae TaxID=2909341 RepID=A0ABS9CXZ5_9RHOB|nr:hypothetical protein [Octadecabacter dasysiphoniae]MCF2872044.1 hypothetical protein [Octadecabacter dasysiphoniae]
MKNARRVGHGALPMSALLVVAGVSGSVAQVSVDDIEAALSALEQSVQSAPIVVAVEAVPLAQPDFEATLPPADILSGLDETEAADDATQDVVFLPLLSEQACPSRLAQIGEQARSLTDQVDAIDVIALELTERFSRIEDQNRAFETDQDLLECPTAFVDSAEQFREDLSQLELADLIQRADTFSACAQEGLQALNNRMEDLAQSSDPDAATDRLAIGGVLRRWANADAEVTEAVSNFVFYDQRGRRLDAATGAILRRCELIGGY